MDNKNTKIDELWKPCPTGMIQQVVDQTGPTLAQASPDTKGGMDRRGLLKIAAAVAVVAGAGALTYRLYDSAKPKLHNYNFVHAGISCEDVLAKLSEYNDQTIEDKELTERIEGHLKTCPKCGTAFETIKESSLS